uniref:Uncharacterized protein n=1 Tax=Arundo donax TaxID=35708 RepID=A0A0A9ASX1_ARUDO
MAKENSCIRVANDIIYARGFRRRPLTYIYLGVFMISFLQSRVF